MQAACRARIWALGADAGALAAAGVEGVRTPDEVRAGAV
jgi:hypothetical protein